MGLTAPGIGSSLDVNGLVSQLMAVERQPLALIQQREATVQAQLSAYGVLQSQIASFGDTAATLGLPANMSNFTATVADTTVASASVDTTASSGSYSLQVSQLAQAQKLASGTFASSSSAFGLGDLTISLGTYDSAGNTFAARTDKTPLVVHVTSANNTLAGVRDAINLAKGGVSASIVTDTSGARLVITSTDTGANNAMKIDAPGEPKLVFDPTVTGTQAVTSLQPAQNAKLTLDNLPIESASNQVTGAVDGLTLNLTLAKPGVSTTITVAQDTSSATQALQQFVASYNALNTLVHTDTDYNAGSSTGGVLQGQVTAVSVLNQMRSAVSGAIPGVAGDFTTLSDIGISLQSDGSLKVDATKLAAATASAGGSAKLARLFIATTSSPDTFTTRIKSFVDKMQGTDGIIPSKTDGLTTSIKAYDQQQTDFNARMVDVEASLRAQFNALDANLASQTAVTAYLTAQDTANTNAARQ
jgi:flagellar hook-associated protein 2